MTLAMKRRTTTARPIQDIKLPGSRQWMVNESTGEFNAHDKRELSQIICSLANMVQAGEVATVVNPERAAKEKAERHNMLVEAYYDENSNAWANLGAAVGGELKITADREGFMRRLYFKSDVQTGTIPRIRVREKNVVAVLSTGPSQLMPTRLYHNYINPAEWYIKTNIRVEQREILQGTNDILDEKFYESLEAIMVAEDRHWKNMADKTVGVSNNNQVLSGGLDPDNLAILKDQITRWRLPCSTMLFASDILTDITGSTFGSWYDPVSQYEIVMTGKIGSLLGMDLITDAYREPNLKVLNAGDIYLMAPPEYHGTFTDRGAVQSKAVEIGDDGDPSRGWFLYEMLSMTLHNTRSVVRGRKT